MTEFSDYSKLIDQETWDFINKTEALCPADSYLHGVMEYRRRYDAMCAEFFRDDSDCVTHFDKRIGDVPVRVYKHDRPNPAAQVVYAHGGSGMLGGLESHNDVCIGICEATGFDLTAVDYRLMPEFNRAESLDDLKSVVEAVAVPGQRLLLVGDSAGGFMAASISHYLKGREMVDGQILIYPGLGGGVDGARAIKNTHAPLLSRAEASLFSSSLSEGQTHLFGYPIPLLQDDFSGLPVTVGIAAECDPLADAPFDYARAINAAGGCAVALEDQGLVHGHLRARHSVERARASFARICKAVDLIGNGASCDELHAGLAG